MVLGTSADKGRPAGGLVRLLSAVALVFLASLTFVISSQALEAPIRADGYSMTGDDNHMRVVVHFDREPDLRWFLLRGPNRLVIDLPGTKLQFDPKDMKPEGLFRAIRYGALDNGASRVVLAGKKPFLVDSLDILKNEAGAGYRVVSEISAASESEFDAALAEQALSTGSTVSTDKSDRVGMALADARRRFTIVIDPGHGGVDGGAESPGGTIEKEVTLAFATQLRDMLAATGRYDVLLTRESDVFLRLSERVQVARQHQADLFISIHADTIKLKGIRGATVYTVADRASDADSQALADRENLSDQLAGIEIKNDNQEVTDILIDLIRRETHTFSMSFANTLVDQLSSVVGLINNPHRYAGFRVLKAPDVPSVLIELGYLSNAKDEAQLTDPAWRGKAAQSIVDAIALFASTRTAIGG